MKKTKMGRPPVDEKGKVLSCYAPPELVKDVEMIMEYTGGTVSEFVRMAIMAARDDAIAQFRNGKLSTGTLKQYTGGSIETPKRK